MLLIGHTPIENKKFKKIVKKKTKNTQQLCVADSKKLSKRILQLFVTDVSLKI